MTEAGGGLDPQGSGIVWPPDAPAAKRSSGTLDSYRRTTDVMRDTTKWIVSFVPGAGLIVTLATVVPSVAKLHASDRVGPTVLLSIGGAFLAVALGVAAWVLAAAPPTWRWLVDTYAAETDGDSPDAHSLKTELDREGVLMLYGYSSPEAFFDSLVDQDLTDIETAPGPATALLDFAMFRQMRGRFITFVAVGVAAGIGAVAFVVAAQYQVASAPTAPPAISSPLTATLAPTAEGVAKLERAAGCVGVTTSSRIAVSVVDGSLVDATVVVDDPACDPTRIEWSGDRDGVVVPLAKGG